MSLVVVVELTVGDAVEPVLVDLEPVRAEARRLGRVGGQLRRGHADVRAAPVEGEAVVGAVRLAIGMVHVDHHRDLFLKKMEKYSRIRINLVAHKRVVLY